MHCIKSMKFAVLILYIGNSETYSQLACIIRSIFFLARCYSTGFNINVKTVSKRLRAGETKQVKPGQRIALALWVDTLVVTWWTHPWWTGLFIKTLLLWGIQADSFKKQFWRTSKRITAETCSPQVEIYLILQKVINMAVMLHLSWFDGKSTPCCKLCRILQYLFAYIICSTIS